jgi:hypothetical protein
MAGGMVGGIGVSLDEAPVEAMLLRIQTAMSPASLTAYLEGEVRPYWHEEAHRHFGTQGTDTAAWAPLAQRTQDERAQLGFDPEYPIQIRTGELEKYLTSDEGKVEADGTGAQWTYPGPTDGLTEKKYKLAQQGNLRTPPREIVQASELNLLDVTTLLMGHLEKMLAVGTLGTLL